MKYEVFVSAFLLTIADSLYNGGCDGNKKNPEIVRAPPKEYYAGVGSTVILQWEYCKTRKSSITGIIISWQALKKRSYLLAIDTTGKTTYYQATHQHSVTWIKENATITFIIMNISMSDAGYYTLEIRRVGYVDIEKRVNVFVLRAVSSSHPKLLTSDFISITKTSIFLSTKNTADHGSSKEFLLMHYPSRTVKPNSVVTTTVLVTKHQKYAVLSKANGDLTISKKYIQGKQEDEYNIVVIIMICIFAGIAPIALLSLVITIYKLRGRLKKRRKMRENAASSNTIIQSQERNLMIQPQRSEMANSELDDSFSASSMSGFSYRDSLDDASDEEPPSTITFGIAQIEAPSGVSHNLATIITHDIKQDSNCPLLPKRKNYELKRELIRDMKMVGQGAFGLVAKAVLMSHKNGLCTVAVKMLKEFASNEDRRDLIEECNLMRRLDSHKNVVQLLGFVLQTEPIWVVTEYVAHGDLLGFLRKCRGIQDSVYHGVATYCGSTLTQHQLLNMAKDIACGMTHLARNKIIHRDLAARNVLVDENINCKITDFGMARDIKSTNYYRTRNRGRIPFKWTAIESILSDKYTTMSDVWSYGIVLYEIVTIGGSPYPRLGPREICRRLKRGWRMEKPMHVSTELYSVMLMCWAANPEDRPSFLVLSGIFGTILGNQSEYINMDEYKHHLYDTVESSSGTSSGFLNELLE